MEDDWENATVREEGESSRRLKATRWRAAQGAEALV